MRLIDVDDLGVGRCSKDVLPAAYCAGWNGLLGLIEKAPTVDAVVVTRCKDCRNHRELNRKDRLESGYAEGILWCMNRSDGVWADGFCSDGEPKEDAHADDHD